MAVSTATALIIAAVATVAAAGTTAYGMYAQGQAQKEMSEYNAEVARNNAIATRQQSTYEKDRLADRARRLRSTQATGYLKSGVTLEGSAQDVLYDSAIESSLDELSVVYRGNVESQAHRSQATLLTMEGDSARQNSYYAAAGAGLSGLGSAAGYYGTARTYGARNPTMS